MAMKTRTSFSRSQMTLTVEGQVTFLPKKSGHLQTRGVTNHPGSREVLTLCSGQFVVPGAHDIDWVLGALNSVQRVQEALNFLKVPGAL